MPPINDNVKLGLKNYRDIIYSDIEKRYPENDKIKYAKRSTSQKKKRSIDSKKLKEDSVHKKKESFKVTSPVVLNKKPSQKYLSPAKSIKKLITVMKPTLIKNKSI